MGTLRAIGRSLEHNYTKRLKSHNSLHRLDSGKLLVSDKSGSCLYTNPLQYLTRRTLFLDSFSSESVRLQRHSVSDSGIVEVSLDRPGAKNAIGKEMLRGLRHTLEMINEDASAKVVLISSLVPKVFCAGADLRERKMMTPPEVQFFVNSLRSTFTFIEALRVPTIAVIEGAALGGGLEMALSCDLRICGEEALFCLPETGLAIIPGAGGTQRLPRLVGKSVAKELIFTGRKIGGREAVSTGLVNYCVPAGEAHLKALEIAKEINQKAARFGLLPECLVTRAVYEQIIQDNKTVPSAAPLTRKGPIAIRMAKKAINDGFEMDLASALELEEECYEQILNTKDRLEGLAAFAEKRKPRYNGE